MATQAPPVSRITEMRSRRENAREDVQRLEDLQVERELEEDELEELSTAAREVDITTRWIEAAEEAQPEATRAAPSVRSQLQEQVAAVEAAWKDLEEREAAEDPDLSESDYHYCIAIAKNARESLLALADEEAVNGDDKLEKDLTSAVDMLTNYVRAQLDQENQDEQAQQTYADDPYVGEAVLNARDRKRSATIVRKKIGGQKEYKFPIPDKAHAKAALSRINQSDLSPEEKAKVRRRAYRMLGKKPPNKSREVDVPVLDEPSDTIIPVQEAPDYSALSEATFNLAKNELTATFLTPGFNRSGMRYYKREAIQESVESGLWNGLKMFHNHASNRELSERPERSLSDWVSTVKETWVDPMTGAGKARIKVCRGWFANFLKELQENDALSDVGLSIFANGRTKVDTVEGRRTTVVEGFHQARSIDWVTEPGAGGRVDALWESFQPIKNREEELNVLTSMPAAEALATLKRERADVLELLKGEVKDVEVREAAEKEKETKLEDLTEATATLQAQITERDELIKQMRLTAFQADQTNLILEAIKDVTLPKVAKSRILALVNAEVRLMENGEALDEAKIKEAVDKAVQEEQEYAQELLKESGVGRGINGLGETAPSNGIEKATSKVETELAKRFGHEPEKES